jgi:hypothetical protein
MIRQTMKALFSSRHVTPGWVHQHFEREPVLQ